MGKPWKTHYFILFLWPFSLCLPLFRPRPQRFSQAVGANGEVPGTDDLDAGAKRVNPEVKTISAAMDDKAHVEHQMLNV